MSRVDLERYERLYSMYDMNGGRSNLYRAVDEEFPDVLEELRLARKCIEAADRFQRAYADGGYSGDLVGDLWDALAEYAELVGDRK